MAPCYSCVFISSRPITPILPIVHSPAHRKWYKTWVNLSNLEKQWKNNLNNKGLLSQPQVWFEIEDKSRSWSWIMAIILSLAALSGVSSKVPTKPTAYGFNAIAQLIHHNSKSQNKTDNGNNDRSVVDSKHVGSSRLEDELNTREDCHAYRFKHGSQFEYQIDNWREYKTKQYSLLSVSIVPVWPSKGNDAVFHVRVSIYYPRVWPPCPPKKMRGWPCDSAVDKGESWSVFRVTPFLSRKRAIVIDRVKRTSLGPQHSYHKIQ